MALAGWYDGRWFSVNDVELSPRLVESARMWRHWRAVPIHEALAAAAPAASEAILVQDASSETASG